MVSEIQMRFARGFSPGRLLRVLYSPKKAFTDARSHPTHLDWLVPAAGYWTIAILATLSVAAADAMAASNALVATEVLIAVWRQLGVILQSAPTLIYAAATSMFWEVVYLLVVFNVFLSRDFGFRSALIILGYTMVLDSLEIVSFAIPMAADRSFTPDTTLNRLIPDQWKETATGSFLAAADLKDLWITFLFETGTTVMAGQQHRRWAVVLALWGLWTAVRAYGVELTW